MAAQEAGQKGLGQLRILRGQGNMSFHSPDDIFQSDQLLIYVGRSSPVYHSRFGIMNSQYIMHLQYFCNQKKEP
jgi:hypothetical protein